MSLLYRVDCDGFTLFDQTAPGYDATEAQLDKEINGGMFEGTLQLTLPCTNPNAAKVRMLASTVTVTEISDGEETLIFRGRPISIETTFDLSTRITCEGDLKFLADIPDIFSQLTKEETDYKIGTESAWEPIHLRMIPEGDLLPRVDKQSRFNRYYENRTYRKDGNSPEQTVWRSAKEPGYFYNNYLYYHHQDDGTQFIDYRFKASEVGKTFTVEFDNRLYTKKYEIPMKTCVYTVAMYGQRTHGTIYAREALNVLNQVISPDAYLYVREREELTAVARYIGNINLIAGDNPKWSGIEGTFDPNEPVTVIGEAENTTLGELDFCIVHYTLAPRWSWSNVGRGGGGLFWSIGGVEETIVYTTASGPDYGVSMRVSSGGRTTVRAMAHAILGRDSNGQYPCVVIDGKKYDTLGGKIFYNGQEYPVVFNAVVIDGGSYGVVEAFYPQDMKNTGLCYRYTGGDVRYVPGEIYQYEPGTGWTADNGAYLDPTESLIEVQSPQDMTDISAAYRYMGEEESYRNGDVYGFNGDRWVQETVAPNNWASFPSGAVVIDGTPFPVSRISSGVDDVTFPQYMTNQRIRYHYTGNGVRYRPYKYYIYESGSGWTETPVVYPEGQYTEVKFPQEMTDKNAAYRYMGEEESYQNGGIYSFNGTRWVKETVNYNHFVSPERRIFLGKCEADSDVDNASVDSCYSNLQKWISETGAFAKTVERDGIYYLDLTTDSGVPSDDFYVKYGENILDAKKTVTCDNIVTGVYAKGVWKGSNDDEGENPEYDLSLQRLFGKEVDTPQQMTDKTAVYKYVGVNESYHTPDQQTNKGGLYKFNPDAGRWKAYEPEEPWDEVEFDYAPTPQDMTDTNKIYQYVGRGTGQKYDITYVKGGIYRYENELWTRDTEAVAPLMSYGFEADYETGVIWNTEAKKEYGNIVFYLEVDVAGVQVSRRTQYMADEAIKALRTKLASFLSFDISVVDPRVIRREGKAPELGNYYPIDIPWLGLEQYYQRLTKLGLNMLDAASTKLTLGNKTPLLSDYVAEKGTRL